MKKVLLFSAILFSTLCVFSYETIIINFPDKELWVKAYYKKVGNEAILQYTPSGESSNNWTRSVVIHSYNNSGLPISSFATSNATRMKKVNPTGQYKTLKYKDTDVILTRCTDDYKTVQGQCEFYRVTRGHNGIVTVHYMNKNKGDFMQNYTQWYDIIKRAKFYYSYYRDERVLDKSEYFEL